MIGLVNIGISNNNSIAKALKYINMDFIEICREDQVHQCSKIIFPGVGSFASATKKLDESGLRSALREHVLIREVPFLGICLGMQLLGTKSEEGGLYPGLGLIDCEVKKIRKAHGIKIPHIGWNNVHHDGTGLLSNIELNADFYFVHGYRMLVLDRIVKIFHTNHGIKISAYVEKNNIFGVQFHPEKSQVNGLKILKNFSQIC